MKKFIKNNKKEIKIVLVILFVILVALLATNIQKNHEYKLEQEKIQQEELKKFEAKGRYDSCVTEYYDFYLQDWNIACKIQGLKDDCNLPAYEAETLEERYVKNKNTCLDIYKAELANI
jgi:hypothetical protein